MTQVLREQVQKPSEPPKTFWNAFQQPTVLAALITVLIGGIAATVITGIIQWRAEVREFQQSQVTREREFEQAWLKSRGDQALVSYKEYLDQENEIIRRTYSSIGACISASDRLIGLTLATWRKPRVNSATVEKQMEEIRSNFNQVRAKWQTEGLEIGLLMGYYHPGQSGVANSWSNVQKSVDAYLQCARTWYDKNPRSQKAPEDSQVRAACKAEYEILVGELNRMTTNLESARRYAWTGWDSPRELRTTLNMR
jgi:hypothetical protein